MRRIFVALLSACGTDVRTEGPDGADTSALPCDVKTMLEQSCQSCHRAPLPPGVPMALATYEDLVAPSSIAGVTVAERAVARMTSSMMPMPPAPGPAATSAQIGVLQSWIAAGYPPGDCGGPGPFDTPPTCTSGVMWTGGDSESEMMNPGKACGGCHDEFAIGGTVYPTAHEPDLCMGAGNATVVITDATGFSVSLPVNAGGNFYYDTSVLPAPPPLTFPIRAKVFANGNERVMQTEQMTGDCNSCHTQTGTNMAPGRIVMP